MHKLFHRKMWPFWFPDFRQIARILHYGSPMAVQIWISCLFCLHNGCCRPFLMSEIHFCSHFWPFQFDTQFLLWKFLTKWLPSAILDVQNSLSIIFLAILDQYEIFKIFFLQNGRRCNRLRCPLARMSGLQCFNMGHNGHGINLYGVSMTLMGNYHAGGQSSLGHLRLVHRRPFWMSEIHFHRNMWPFWFPDFRQNRPGSMLWVTNGCTNMNFMCKLVTQLQGTQTLAMAEARAILCDFETFYSLLCSPEQSTGRSNGVWRDIDNKYNVKRN